MSTAFRNGLRTMAGLIVLGGTVNIAHAQLTPANTLIQNQATVSYTVGGVTQTPIESSPLGNSTPGAGQFTTFRVDQLVDLAVSESSGNETITSPGANPAVIAFTVQNDGNAPQGYQLTIAEEIGTLLFGNTDSFDIGLANLLIRVDEDPSGGDGTGNDTYDGTETATAIDILNPGAQITVFVVAAVPLTAVNGTFANVNLHAQTAVANTSGGTLQAASPGPNTLDNVEVVFGDDLDATPFDGGAEATDQYAIQSAALTVTKTAVVTSDPFGNSPPFAVPGAVVEYTVSVANTGTSAADGVGVADDIPANTVLQEGPTNGPYPGPTDVQIQLDANPATFCVADAGDANADGCDFDGAKLTVGSGALGTIPAGSTATVKFRVKIN